MNLDFLEKPEVKEALLHVGPSIEAMVKEYGLDQDPTFKRVLDGETIAQARGLSREDLDVLYEYGFNFITGGQLQKAEDVFINLCIIDPLEAKNHYCLGVVRQMQQSWLQAVDDFSRFLAMDATNPEGYLRIAECHVALGETELAKEVLGIAAAEAAKGNGPEDAVAQVERALENLGTGGVS